jgi:hypothetical protein
MTSAAHMAFDELTLESFKWENTLCAADAVAQNLPYPPEEHHPVRDIKASLEVSLPPAYYSAPPRCRLRITVALSSFACLRPTKGSWSGRYMANRRSTNSKTYRNGCIPRNRFPRVPHP